MGVANLPHRTARWNSPWLIAAVAVVVVIVATVGIGFGTGLFRPGNQPGPPVAASPSPLGSPSPSMAPSPSPSAIPVPSQPLVVIVNGTEIRLVSLDGTEVASVTASSVFLFVGVIGSRVEYVDGGTLKALHRDGTVETLANSCGYCQPVHPVGELGGLIISPDGSQFMWSEYQATGTAPSGGTTYHSTLHLSKQDGSDRVVANLDAEWQILAPYRWDSGGAIVQHAMMGIGGSRPILVATGPVFLLDPVTATLSPLWDSTSCSFWARSVDGTIACTTWNPVTISIGRPPTVGTAVALGGDGSQGIAGVSFKPGASVTSVAVAIVEIDPQDFTRGDRFHTGLIDVASGRLSPFGPDGLRPAVGDWIWLDDGSLIEVRPDPMTWATTATYVVSRSGNATQIATAGTPVGLLRV